MNGKQIMATLVAAIERQQEQRRRGHQMIADGLRLQAKGLPALAATPGLRQGLESQAQGFEALATSEVGLADTVRAIADQLSGALDG